MCFIWSVLLRSKLPILLNDCDKNLPCGWHSVHCNVETVNDQHFPFKCSNEVEIAMTIAMTEQQC